VEFSQYSERQAPPYKRKAQVMKSSGDGSEFMALQHLNRVFVCFEHFILRVRSAFSTGICRVQTYKRWQWLVDL